MDLFENIKRGVPGRPAHKQEPPDAQWLDPQDAMTSGAYRFDGGKVFLGVLGGVVDDDGREYYVTGGQAVGIGDERHVALCAGSRAGKGRSVLVPTLLEYQGSVLALDPKGELASITARRRAELGQRVCIVDPFGVVKAAALQRYKAGFNPMMMLRRDSRDVIEDAGLIADALVPAESHDPHWDDSARTFVEGLLLHVATARQYQGRNNLAVVRDLMMNGADCEADDGSIRTGMSGLALEMTANATALDGEGYEDIARVLSGAVSDFFDRPENERGGVESTARRHLKFLDYPRIRESVARHDFELTQLKTEGNGLTIYVCLPAGRMGTCSRWFRLFVNMALQAMEREETKPRIPVLAVLEEFHVLGNMRQLEVAAGLVAGFGMKLLMVLQDLTQLKRHYKEGWETFLGNAGVLIFFGNSDVTTLDFISKRCGQTSLEVERGSFMQADQRAEGGRSDSWSLEVKDLITSEEASRVFGRDDDQQRELIIRAGESPMILQRVKYDRHELFRGKWDKA